jgi:hypothetical protein
MRNRVNDQGTSDGLSFVDLVEVLSHVLSDRSHNPRLKAQAAKMLGWAESRLATNPRAFEKCYGRKLEPLWDGNGPHATMPDQEGTTDELA